MNSELEAIMRRRRRKADGLPGSPNPYNNQGGRRNNTQGNGGTSQQNDDDDETAGVTGTATTAGSHSHRARALLIGIPPPPPPTPPPPPPSSVSSTRKTHTTFVSSVSNSSSAASASASASALRASASSASTSFSRRRMEHSVVVGPPPPPPPPPPVKTKTSPTTNVNTSNNSVRTSPRSSLLSSATSSSSTTTTTTTTRRRALDQIRSARRNASTTAATATTIVGATTSSSSDNDDGPTTSPSSSLPESKIASPLATTTTTTAQADDSILTHGAVVHNDSTMYVMRTPQKNDDEDEDEDDNHHYDGHGRQRQQQQHNNINDDSIMAVIVSPPTTTAAAVATATEVANHDDDEKDDNLQHNPTDESQEFLTPASTLSSSDPTTTTTTTTTVATGTFAATATCLSPLSSSSSPSNKESSSSLLFVESSSSFLSSSATETTNTNTSTNRSTPAGTATATLGSLLQSPTTEPSSSSSLSIVPSSSSSALNADNNNDDNDVLAVRQPSSSSSLLSLEPEGNVVATPSNTRNNKSLYSSPPKPERRPPASSSLDASAATTTSSFNVPATPFPITSPHVTTTVGGAPHDEIVKEEEEDDNKEVESSVESPARSPTRSIMSSSVEEEHESEKMMTTNAVTTTSTPFDPMMSSSSFANFEADFGSFPTTTTSGLFDDSMPTADYEPPPPMYEPPPALFPAFDSLSSSLVEPSPPPPAIVVDYTPLENVPSRVEPRVELKQRLVLSADKKATTDFPTTPVTNPLTGNVITCRINNNNGDGTVGISEIQIDACAQVEYTPIVTSQVREKFKTKMGSSVYAVSKVWSMAAGVHRSRGQQARVRVAALVEFHTVQAGKKVLKTVLLVWQWGYGSTRPVALQSLLSPPNKASFTYEPESLQMSDGVVFLSGMAKNKGPCVFCVKPYLKDVWSANLVPGTGTISSMAVTSHRKYKYIALAQTDGLLSVWTYESAADRKGAETPKTLFPLCRLDGVSAIANSTETAGDSDGYISEEKNYCTGLAWVGTDMLMLAAAFTKGMAVYHISLPLLVESSNPDAAARPISSPTASTQLSQTVMLSPFVASQWSSPVKRVSVSWVDLGSSPCLCFLLLRESTFESIMGVINLPLYGATDARRAATSCSFRVFGSIVLSTEDEDPSFVDFVCSYSVGSAVFHNRGSIVTITPSLSTDDAFFRSLMCPAISAAPGLDSAGFVSVPDGNDRDGILQIFSVKQCQRGLSDLPSPAPDTQRLDWSLPKQRYLLCRSFAGDNKDAQNPSPEVQAASEYGDIESITAGSHTELICDVKLDENLVPRRIVRCKDASLCAVLLYRALGHSDGPSSDAISVALIDTCRGDIITVREGRDVIFLPNITPGNEHALILSTDGSSLRSLRRVPSSDEADEVRWEESAPARAVLGFEANEDYLEGRRLFLLSSEGKLTLLVVGTRTRDERSCLVCGNPINLTRDENDEWQRLIPSMKKDSVFWLKANETIQSLLSLPSHQGSNSLLAMATSSRLVLLSRELRIVAEMATRLVSTSLAPLGSHAVAYCSRDFKLRYLCSLSGKFSSGLLATLPSPRVGHRAYQLMAVRPDRFIYTNNSGRCARLVEGENADRFPLPTATTRPALLLEPMVASAICESNTPGKSTAVLRAVVERFGRKVTSFPHGDDEGIGSAGSGITPKVLEMLSVHGLKHAASWLLTGSCSFDRGANSRVLPPWMPVNAKTAAALNRDADLHVVANGDQYFSDYVKSPDNNMASTLPRPTDPSAVFCHGLALKAMEDGDVAGALKLLDVAGAASSDSALLQLALSLQLEEMPDISQVLKTLSGQKDDGYARSLSHQSTTSSLAALVLDLKSRQVNGRIPQQGGECAKVSDEMRRRYMTQLAPSVQRSRRAHRDRHRLIGEAAWEAATRGLEKVVDPDSRWQVPCNESKHVWNEGPQKDKENILLLDRMEEWLGRRRPVVLGKEGAEAALERGEKTLADILNKANDYDDDSFGGQSGGDEAAVLKDGWVAGIGSGRADEDNLSLYLRMSEGADEDSTWRTDGFLDLTPYANKATLLGQRECFALAPTSSSVDEGEPGKVKLLYDLVFEAPRDGEGPGGLLLEAPRGSSLDVGMLHSDENDERRRCSLEFWFHLPVAASATEEIVLVRRSVSPPGDVISKLCDAGNNDGFLWELAVLPSGEVEFRSNGGTSLLSTSESSSEFESNQAMGDFGDDTDHSNDDGGGLVSWERPEGGGGWNHVCLVLSSRQQNAQTDCTVKMFLRGAKVATTIARIIPPGLEGDGFVDAASVDDAMKKSVYLFGLNAVPDYRMTEVRLWSCERNEDDIKMMMYEYLRAAETKKKFKVRIRNKKENDTAAMKPSTTGGLLSPPPSAGALLSPPRERGTKGLLPPPRKSSDTEATSNAPLSDGKNFDFDASFGTFGNAETKDALVEADLEAADQRASLPNSPKASPEDTKAPDLAAMDSTWAKMQTDHYSQAAENITPQATDRVVETKPSVSRLSQQVRSSAAAALVRGPPATRHFGGNRGGLARASPGDRNESNRFGVGSIAICGAEKTVVYDHDQEPKGKTYPIGASGAVISDEMDNGEYLCCFLAKDKRMVVFELLTRTVVVELQMTTKLNFWRYLPPQAHGHTLVFMLITPVGGFHWVPLDESPRPIQVWKRGPAVQGKKIVTYEEGGSNGFSGAEALSVVALLLVSTASTGTPLEAWILQVGGESKALCVSSNVLGAALFRPFHIQDEAFLPHLVTATRVESEIVLKVEPLSQDPATGDLAVEADVSIGAILDQSHVRRALYSPPALAMGGWPEVIVCSCQGFVVACVRRKGLVVAYDCQEELVLVRQVHVENYIVDGALRPASNGNNSDNVELILLLSDGENARDGFVMSVGISRQVK